MTPFGPPFEEFARSAGLAAFYGIAAGHGVYGVSPLSEKPRGWVLLIHGLCEHPGRFFHLARFLARRGWASVMPVLEGHGHAPGRFARWRSVYEAAFREDDPDALSRFYSDKAREWREDQRIAHRANLNRQRTLSMADHRSRLGDVVEQVAAFWAAGPQFVLGHSLGGLLACAMGRDLAGRPGKVPRGVVLINPALQPIGRPGLEARMVELSWRRRKTVLFREGGCVQRLARMIRQTIDVAWSSEAVSDLPAEVRLHRADPLNLRRVSGAYLLAIQSLMSELEADPRPYPVPAFLAASGCDRIVNGAGALQFGRRLSQETGLSHRVFFFEELFAHDLSRSTCWPRLQPGLENWMQACLS